MRRKPMRIYLPHYFIDIINIVNSLTSVERAVYYMCTEEKKSAPDVQATIDASTVNTETSYTDLLLVISHSIIVQSWEYTIYTHHT